MDRATRFFHQLLHRQRLFRFVRRTARRPELERAHATPAHVGKAIQGGDIPLVDAAARHPGIDQLIAEIIGQRVRQQARQALEGIAIQRRERERPSTGDGHRQWGKFDAAPQPCRIVFEGMGRDRRIDGHRADAPAPDADFDREGLQCAHPRFRGARFGSAFCVRNSAIGLIVGAGASASSDDSASSALSTLTYVIREEPLPRSRSPKARGDTPARLASSA